MLTIIFAIVLVSIAGVSSAQSPTPPCAEPLGEPLQYDGETALGYESVPAPLGIAVAQAAGGAIPTKRLRGDASTRLRRAHGIVVQLRRRC